MSHLRALLLSSDPQTIHTCAEVMRSLGCETFNAANSAQAASVIENLHPEFAIIDIDQTGADDVTSQIEALHCATTPIALANGEAPSISGACIRLNKPISAEDLKAAIQRAAAQGKVALETPGDAETAGGNSQSPVVDGATGVRAAQMPLRRARSLWISEFERKYLTDLIRSCGDNVSQAARTAGVDRKTMRRLLQKYGLR